MKREELLRNKGYWVSKIQIDLYNQLESYINENNTNRSELAKKLGVSKGYISQVLNGDFNHRISTLVELSLAINKVPIITFKDLDQFIQHDTEGYKTVTWNYKVNPSEIGTLDQLQLSGLSSGESKPINENILQNAVGNLS